MLRPPKAAFCSHACRRTSRPPPSGACRIRALLLLAPTGTAGPAGHRRPIDVAGPTGPAGHRGPAGSAGPAGVPWSWPGDVIARNGVLVRYDGFGPSQAKTK